MRLKNVAQTVLQCGHLLIQADVDVLEEDCELFFKCHCRPHAVMGM